MTAAPGPQQPDEVPVGSWDDFETGAGDEQGPCEVDATGWCERHLHRPAAPSAQPDEDARRWAVATEVASRYFGRQDDEYRDLLADVHAALSGHITSAAPSAQPDEAQHERFGGSCMDCGGIKWPCPTEVRRVEQRSAQPVRDTEEGRR